jgi:hypothetical protein
MREQRLFSFKNLEVEIMLHEQRLVEEIREEFCNKKQWDYVKSFDMVRNYSQIIEAAKIIKDKPSRVFMKFETFDHKFSICFVESKNFSMLCGLIKN